MTNNNKQVLVYGMGGIGGIFGILLAVKRKSGFLGGVGWYIVFGIAGTMAGYIVVALIPTTNDPLASPPVTASSNNANSNSTKISNNVISNTNDLAGSNYVQSTPVGLPYDVNLSQPPVPQSFQYGDEFSNNFA